MGPGLHSANETAGPNEASVQMGHNVLERKSSFRKGPTDRPLQNDYCSYSCITMF